MNLWIAGKHQGDAPWEFVGVFDDEAKAVAACIEPCMFVAPAALNQTTPQETTPWPGAYYPHHVEEQVA